MKKVKSGNRSSAAKGNGAPKNVDEYLAGVPEPARSTLNKIRAAIRAAVPPEATETISYRTAFKYKEVLVWFAAFSNHCSLFPTASVVEAFKNELKGFSTSKGTIHFPTDKPLPTALVKKLVKARVAQNASCALTGGNVPCATAFADSHPPRSSPPRARFFRSLLPRNKCRSKSSHPPRNNFFSRSMRRATRSTPARVTPRNSLGP